MQKLHRYVKKYIGEYSDKQYQNMTEKVTETN